MPRQIINGAAVRQLPASYYPVTPLDAGAADLVFTSTGDQPDRNVILSSGKTLVIAHNTDADPHTLTINSVADNLNRVGDIEEYIVGAGKIALFGPFLSAGWSNAGKLDTDVDDPLLVVTIVNMP